MTYRAHIRNGEIALDEPAVLPEGAEVQVEVLGADPVDLVRRRRACRIRLDPELGQAIASLPDVHPTEL